MDSAHILFVQKKHSTVVLLSKGNDCFGSPPAKLFNWAEPSTLPYVGLESLFVISNPAQSASLAVRTLSLKHAPANAKCFPTAPPDKAASAARWEPAILRSRAAHGAGRPRRGSLPATASRRDDDAVLRPPCPSQLRQAGARRRAAAGPRTPHGAGRRAAQHQPAHPRLRAPALPLRRHAGHCGPCRRRPRRPIP